jgi:hypothetical protein
MPHWVPSILLQPRGVEIPSPAVGYASGYPDRGGTVSCNRRCCKSSSRSSIRPATCPWAWASAWWALRPGRKHGFGLVVAAQQRGDQPFAVRRDPGPEIVNGHPIHARRALVRFDPLVGGSGSQSLPPPPSGAARSSSGSAVAAVAVAQRRLQGLVEEVLLVAAALLSLHAHLVGSDCSLAAEFGPSHTATQAATTASADFSARIK